MMKKAVVRNALVLVMGVLLVGLLAAIRPDRTSDEVPKSAEVGQEEETLTVPVLDTGLRVYEREDGTTVYDYSNFNEVAALVNYVNWVNVHPEEVQRAYEEWFKEDYCLSAPLNYDLSDPGDRAELIATCRSVGIWITGPQQA